MREKLMRWGGIVLCGVGGGLMGGLFGIGPLLISLVQLVGFSVWILADLEQREERLVQEVAEAVAKELMGEDAPERIIVEKVRHE